MDTLANKELQNVKGILGDWIGLLRYGSQGQGPGNWLYKYVHIITIAC